MDDRERQQRDSFEKRQFSILSDMAENNYIFSTGEKTAVQARSFLILSAVALAAGLFWSSAVMWSADAEQQSTVQNYINPNHACRASLVRLPGIGRVTAEKIISYRRDCRKQNPDCPAFERLNDLRKVDGIGEKTIEKVDQYIEIRGHSDG